MRGERPVTMCAKCTMLLALTIGVLVAWSHAVPLPTDKAAGAGAEGKQATNPQSSAPAPAQAKPPCGSCYGAADEQKGIKCCDSCDDVRHAYKEKGWAWPGQSRPCVALQSCKRPAP